MKIYLDLLPKQRKLEIKRKKTFRSILRQEALFLLPLFVFIAILLNIYYLISIQHETLVAAHSNTQTQNKYQELSSYEDKFKQVNESVELLLKIKAGHLKWGNVFEKVNETVPDGIRINDFSTKNYKVLLAGEARNRDILLKFKSDIESNQCFESVNVPLSNLVVKENIEFQIDFSVKQNCLKGID